MIPRFTQSENAKLVTDDWLLFKHKLEEAKILIKELSTLVDRIELSSQFLSAR